MKEKTKRLIIKKMLNFVPLITENRRPNSQLWRAKKVNGCVFLSLPFSFYLVSPHILQERSQHLWVYGLVLLASKTLDDRLSLVQAIMSNEPSGRFWKNPRKEMRTWIFLTATFVKENEIYLFWLEGSGGRLGLGRERIRSNAFCWFQAYAPSVKITFRKMFSANLV